MTPRQQGFTLMELMVVTVLFTIMVSFAWPAFEQTLDNAERRSTLNSVYHTLSLARAEAIKSATPVTVCPLNGSDTCIGDWTHPVSVFRDPNNQRSLTDQEHLIHIMESPDKGRLRVRTGNRGYFQYAPTGYVRGTLGNITYCPQDNDPEKAGQLIINMGGRVRYAKDLDGDGIVEGSNGSAVSCP